MSRRIILTCMLIFLGACVSTNRPSIMPSAELYSMTLSVTLASTYTRGSTLAPDATPIPVEWASPSPSASPTEIPAISLAAVGDIMLARTLGDRILRNEGDAIFSAVAPTLRSADIAIGNLECAIGSDGTRAPKAYTFRAPPAAAGLLQDAGFDLVSLANNHSMDYGEYTLAETMELLRANGIAAIGAGQDAYDAHVPVRFTVRGVRLAFLAYADVPKEHQGFDVRSWTAGPTSPGIAWADPESMWKDIQGVRSSVDFVIVMLHFGEEGRVEPTQEQATLAYAAIDSGADLVIGSHPHVLGSVEQYKDGWIFYSLGNFVFDGFSGISNDSKLLWITLSPGKLISFGSIPIRIENNIPMPSEPIGE